jgi:hypothetical protein
MENKQLFTKVAVSILIGLNVGAYYVFWPHQDGGAKPAAKKPDEDKGQTKLLPTKPEQPTPKPAELPILTSVPLSIPNPKKAEFSPEEAVNKLLDHIKREKDVVPTPIPMFPEDQAKPTVDKNVGVTSPLTPKVPDSVVRWRVVSSATSMKGPQTHAMVQLNRPDVAFSVRYEALTVVAGSDDLEAKGNVQLVHGAVLVVKCERLRFAHNPSRIIFEGNVVIAPVESWMHTLRTDRVVWDFEADSTMPQSPLGPPK